MICPQQFRKLFMIIACKTNTENAMMGKFIKIQKYLALFPFRFNVAYEVFSLFEINSNENFTQL